MLDRWDERQAHLERGAGLALDGRITFASMQQQHPPGILRIEGIRLNRLRVHGSSTDILGFWLDMRQTLGICWVSMF